MAGFAAKAEAQKGRMKQEMEKAMRLSCAQVRDSAKANAPRDTGEIARSITYRVIQEGSTMIGRVYSLKDYAAYVEFGTGPEGRAHPHELAGSKGISYRPTGWVYPLPTASNEAGGQQFRFTMGQPAKPFLYPAFKKHKKRIEDNLRAAVRRAVK